MDTKHQHPTPQAGKALFITDRELAPLLGVSVGFLQKDRREGQRIPFVRLGDRCLYELSEALSAVKALTVGGRRAQAAGDAAGRRCNRRGARRPDRG